MATVHTSVTVTKWTQLKWLLLLFSHYVVSNSFCSPMPPAQAPRPWDFPDTNTGGAAISFSKGFSWPGEGTHVSCICRWIPYHWATREALTQVILSIKKKEQALMFKKQKRKKVNALPYRSGKVFLNLSPCLLISTVGTNTKSQILDTSPTQKGVKVLGFPANDGHFNCCQTSHFTSYLITKLKHISNKSLKISPKVHWGKSPYCINGQWSKCVSINYRTCLHMDKVPKLKRSISYRFEVGKGAHVRSNVIF